MASQPARNPAGRPRPSEAYANTEPACGTTRDISAYDQAVNAIAMVAST